MPTEHVILAPSEVGRLALFITRVALAYEIRGQVSLACIVGDGLVRLVDYTCCFGI